MSHQTFVTSTESRNQKRVARGVLGVLPDRSKQGRRQESFSDEAIIAVIEIIRIQGYASEEVL